MVKNKSRYEYQKDYREKNKEKIKNLVSSWYKKNKEHRRKYQREYYERNKKEILTKKRKNYGNKKNSTANPSRSS